jgi:hypothetical protein
MCLSQVDKSRLDALLVVKADKSIIEAVIFFYSLAVLKTEFSHDDMMLQCASNCQSLSSLDLAINRHEQSIASIRVKLA